MSNQYKILLIASAFLLNGCLFEEIAITGLGLRDAQDTIIVSDGSYLYKASPSNFVSADNKTMLTRINLETGTSTHYLGTTTPNYTDGTGTTVRFNSIRSMVSIPNTTKIYIGDNCTLRQLDTQSSTVVTVAGSTSECGAGDGIGSSARFSLFISGLAYHDGYLYAVDGYAIRRINLQNMHVTTIAGGYNLPGNQDGNGTYARFGEMTDIAYLNGYLYFADISNKKIRKMNLDTSAVTTAFGDGSSFSSDGQGTNTKVNIIASTRFTTDSAKLIFFTEDTRVRKIDVDTQTITTLINSQDTIEDKDGPLDSAKLFFPSGIAYTMSGLFISNFYGVRRLR